MNKANPISGILTITVGALISWISNSYGLSGLAPDPMGPAFYPKLLGAVLIALGLLLIWKAIRTKEGNKEEEEKKPGILHSGNLRMILVIASGIMYIIVFEPLGFLLTTALFIISVMIISGERVWRKLGITSITVTISLYLIFKEILDVLLPAGFGL